MLKTANADLILWVYDKMASAILILKFTSSEIKLKGIRAPHRFNLPENMLLLSLILIVADPRRRTGFKHLLDLVQQSVETWTPEVENWSNEKWERVLLRITKHWQLLQCFSVTIPDLKGELSDVIDELKRISSGEGDIFREPRLILKRTVISEDIKTDCQGRTTISRNKKTERQGLTGNATWRLLCLSVAVEVSGEEPGPDLRAAATHISELGSLLNQSPLFAASPISYAETELGFQILKRWLFPPNNHVSDNKASPEGTLAAPSQSNEASVNGIRELQAHQAKGRRETESGEDRTFAAGSVFSK
jgi:hypothetical protein